MSKSMRHFRIELYEEHLAEGSFLREQRTALIGDESIAWPDLRPFEQRLDAHLDALVAGGDLALQTCIAATGGSDPHELFCAIGVICRAHRVDLLAAALARFDWNDLGKVEALRAALERELPRQWSGFVESALASENEVLVQVISQVCGSRRIFAVPALRAALVSCPGAVTQILRALGRLGAADALVDMKARSIDERPEIRAAALEALLLLGHPEVIPVCHFEANSQPWARRLLGLGGSRASNEVLMRIAQTGQVDAECLLAMGLLGDLRCLPTLHACLQEASLRAIAALAMHWITGAMLFGEVFRAEEVKEEELFDGERRRWLSSGEPPRRADGQPYGTAANQLSTDPDLWKEWLGENVDRFNPSTRYRKGRPFAFEAILSDLQNPATDRRLRSLEALELPIRMGCGFAAEVDAYVGQQIVALSSVDKPSALKHSANPENGWQVVGLRH